MKLSSSFTIVMKTSSLQLPSLAGTLSIKSMLQSAPKHVIFIFKIQKFSGERGHSPLPHHTHPFVPSVLTHAPPTRKSGYGPAVTYWCAILNGLDALCQLCALNHDWQPCCLEAKRYSTDSCGWLRGRRCKKSSNRTASRVLHCLQWADCM